MYKQIGAINITVDKVNENQVLAVIPEGKNTEVKNIVVNNRNKIDGQDSNVKIYTVPSGEEPSEDFIFFDSIVSRGQRLTLTDPVLLAESDSIVVNSSIENVNFIAYGNEVGNI